MGTCETAEVLRAISKSCPLLEFVVLCSAIFHFIKGVDVPLYGILAHV